MGKFVAMNKCSGSLNTKSDLKTNIYAAWSNSAYLSFNSISKFPTFYGFKQGRSDCPELLFRRISRADIRRVECALDDIKNRRHAVIIGLPGIGKTAELNDILMKLLEIIKSWFRPKQRYEGVIKFFDRKDSK